MLPRHHPHTLTPPPALQVADVHAGVEKLGFNKLGGALLIALWLAVLITVVVLAGQTEYDSHKGLHWFAAFYRTGSIIFGGGQVSARTQGAASCDALPPMRVALRRPMWRAAVHPTHPPAPSPSPPTHHHPPPRWCCPCFTTTWSPKTAPGRPATRPAPTRSTRG